MSNTNEAFLNYKLEIWQNFGDMERESKTKKREGKRYWEIKKERG